MAARPQLNWPRRSMARWVLSSEAWPADFIRYLACLYSETHDPTYLDFLLKNARAGDRVHFSGPVHELVLGHG
jgi:hypothetical protein